MEFPYHQRPNTSQLETYRAEITSMRASNWPFYKVAQWLEDHKQVKVSKEAVRQFCKVRKIGYLPQIRPVAKKEASAKSESLKFHYDDSLPINTNRKL